MHTDRTILYYLTYYQNKYNECDPNSMNDRKNNSSYIKNSTSEMASLFQGRKDGLPIVKSISYRKTAKIFDSQKPMVGPGGLDGATGNTPESTTAPNFTGEYCGRSSGGRKDSNITAKRPLSGSSDMPPTPKEQPKKESSTNSDTRAGGGDVRAKNNNSGCSSSRDNSTRNMHSSRGATADITNKVNSRPYDDIKQLDNEFKSIYSLANHVYGHEYDELAAYLDLDANKISVSQGNSQDKILAVFNQAISNFKEDGLAPLDIRSKFQDALINIGRQDLADQIPGTVTNSGGTSSTDTCRFVPCDNGCRMIPGPAYPSQYNPFRDGQEGKMSGLTFMFPK